MDIEENLRRLFPEILLEANYTDIISFCLTNREYSKICNDEYFWMRKTFHDFGDTEEIRYSFNDLSQSVAIHNLREIYLEILDEELEQAIVNNLPIWKYLELLPEISGNWVKVYRLNSNVIDLDVIRYFLESPKSTDEAINEASYLLGTIHEHFGKYTN